MVTLNHAVAVAMVHGPRAGLELLATLDADERIAGHHRLDAVRAHLLEMAGDTPPPATGYRAAARGRPAFPSSATSRPAPRGSARAPGREAHGRARAPRSTP